MYIQRAAGPAVPAAGPGRSSFHHVLARTDTRARVSPPPVQTASVQAGGVASSLAQRVCEAQTQLDTVLQQARAGRSFSPAELLGLQVRVCQASQVIDFAGKAVDKAVGGLKQVLQTPV